MGRPTPSCIVHRIQDAGHTLELLKADIGKQLGHLQVSYPKNV
jgi:hypothetical protein